MANVVAMVMRRCEEGEFEPRALEDFRVTVQSVKRKKSE